VVLACVMFTLTLLGVQVCGERLRMTGKFTVPCTFVHLRRYFVSRNIRVLDNIPLYCFDNNFFRAGEAILVCFFS